MRDCYFQRLGRYEVAMVDLLYLADDFSLGPCWLITRINVPRDWRRQGIGNALLDRVIEDADYENIPLILEVIGSGDMSDEDLIEWYRRKGFENCPAGDNVEDTTLIRYPQEQEESHKEISHEQVS